MHQWNYTLVSSLVLLSPCYSQIFFSATCCKIPPNCILPLRWERNSLCGTDYIALNVRSFAAQELRKLWTKDAIICTVHHVLGVTEWNAKCLNQDNRKAESKFFALFPEQKQWERPHNKHQSYETKFSLINCHKGESSTGRAHRLNITAIQTAWRLQEQSGLPCLYCAVYDDRSFRQIYEWAFHTAHKMYYTSS